MATPDKPSQSSSNGSKNGSGDNTVAFIVIAAIVVLAVQYFLTGTNFALDIWEEFTAPELSNAEIAEFEETLDQIDQNAATYASGGFQTEEDIKNAIAAQKARGLFPGFLRSLIVSRLTLGDVALCVRNPHAWRTLAYSAKAVVGDRPIGRWLPDKPVIWASRANAPRRHRA